MSHDHVPRFDSVAPEYLSDLNNNLRLTGGDSQFFFELKIKHIVNVLDFEPKRILEFGCATGTFAKMLSDQFRNADVVGYDPAVECIKLASKNFISNERLKFIDDLGHLEFSPDLIVATGVFHHIPPEQKQKAMNDLFRISAPAGVVFIFEHNPLSPLTQLIVAMADVDKGATLIRRGNMENMMIKAGFKNLKPKFISFFPPILKTMLPLEKYLEWMPLGAQHLVVGYKSPQ